ncbi:OLC1v1028410C1 [Oldenlandia corymbosa var. corymbosa]|uniref:OLC1v1028410C1 n=1 Tax=Oldenlandia corymbosa var. corymbosa TaxID=529605 RepID=A0AAV1CE99_OLDCO|nr:OLC1v1028410C1 [Oldenlandia corymbosa var. corymbosa]
MLIKINYMCIGELQKAITLIGFASSFGSWVVDQVNRSGNVQKLHSLGDEGFPVCQVDKVPGRRSLGHSLEYLSQEHHQRYPLHELHLQKLSILTLQRGKRSLFCLF